MRGNLYISSNTVARMERAPKEVTLGGSEIRGMSAEISPTQHRSGQGSRITACGLHPGYALLYPFTSP